MPRTRHTTRRKAERLWVEHCRQLYGLARSYERITGVDYADLIDVAQLAFMRTAEQMDWADGTASFNTLLFRIASNAMRSEIRRAYTRRKHTVSLALTGEQACYTSCSAFSDKLTLLSSDARELVRIICTVPDDVLGLDYDLSPKRLRGRLRAYLRKQQWPHSKIWAAFRELRALTAPTQQRGTL